MTRSSTSGTPPRGRGRDRGGALGAVVRVCLLAAVCFAGAYLVARTISPRVTLITISRPAADRSAPSDPPAPSCAWPAAARAKLHADEPRFTRVLG